MAGEAADVQGQLESVLSNLYDFGEDLEPTTKVNVSESEQQSEDALPNIKSEDVTDLREDQPPNLDFPVSKRGKKNPSFFFNAIKDELRSQPKCADVPSSSVSNPHVEVVRFVSRKDKKQAKNSGVQDSDSMLTIDSKEENIQTFDFEKARLEVHKFGIRGYKKEKQRKFEQERAIMLGAKPPKREYVNYKVYQEKKKEQEQTKKEKSLLENTVESVKKKQKQGQNVRRSRKSKSSGFVPDGQVGRFRDGALILSSNDIHKIKQSKVLK